MFQGENINVLPLAEDFVELRFDRNGDSINKLDRRAMAEFSEAVAYISAKPSVRGVLVTSAKDVFIVGADIKEFGQLFAMPEQELAAWTLASNRGFCAFEDLDIPTVVAINGFALGGGLEMALCGALRVMASSAKVGLPEVNLGLIPGFGGTVRLPRVAGLDVAASWIAGGKPASAASALEAGVVDKVCEPAWLREGALELLRRAADGEVDWRAAQQRKRQAVLTQEGGPVDALEAVTGRAIQADGRHLPAALTAVNLLREALNVDREAALKLESEAFARVAKTQAAGSLVQAFLNEQHLKKHHRDLGKQARKLEKAAVLGAGAMGGGIAYTSALSGIPVLLKDVRQEALDAGVREAERLLARQVKAGRLKAEKAKSTLAAISPQLDFAGFRDVDLLVEAVVENLDVKKRVLSDIETEVRDDTVIASNTSSLLIDDIAQGLRRPENFVGMHFFNPVPAMALVEIVRGVNTSDEAIATVVKYAVAMGKTPIVVRDCPGFLVNRILTQYVRAFLLLVEEGADFLQIDRVMEALGWPMGPACLQDVIGMDVSSHVVDVISAGYPGRMPAMPQNALNLMVSLGRHGQKSGLGFYTYERDESGKLAKTTASDTHELLKKLQRTDDRKFSDSEIVERMMLPIIVEAAVALEEGVVASSAELDTALLLGIGFPSSLGGAFKYADWLGMAEVVRQCDQYAHLGGAYSPTQAMRKMASDAATYYPRA
ncbi:fatty acid oxidation complex subunit alpha FadB [Paraburkholderia saeva]|uniref:fatty acid oxidation complex subunit alpha FadB n=1 Tax=Paraburkholderia saeva TaxID=2777537 RepID=UPI001D54B531|nr:fatty acid oxidation complex subunit alpha FadB [Paraburkholderia saeva]CAG4906666.1 Fatty acid oxidation complex subunit alpha [Paraburkholderia saeva]